jgi:micrococcal nuclease
VSDPHAPAPQVWSAPQPRKPKSLGEKVGLGCLGLFAAFGILVALGLMLDDPEQPATTATEETPTPTASAPAAVSDRPTTPSASARPTTAKQAPTANAKPRQPKPPAVVWLPVVRVVDGDTIEVNRGGEQVTLRLIGIDTPETVHPTEPVGCWGPEASAQAHKLLDGQSVRLEYDASQGRLDKYDRTLAYVWLRDGRMFNEVMIKGGFAEEYTYDGAYRYQQRFRTAEHAAQQRDAGVWSSECEQPAPPPKPAVDDNDPRFDTCGEAIDNGYGPYNAGTDPEYDWYRDADSDGVVCES